MSVSRNRENVAFRVDEELLEDFDDTIFRKKVDGELDRDTSRSEVLRELMRGYIDGT